MKPTLRLFGGVGLGLIIEFPSGVVYSNQTGGSSCLHPELEGVFVPLCNDCEVPSMKLMSPEVMLSAYFEGPRHQGTGATDGLSRGDADFIDQVIDDWQLGDFMRVDRDRLRESHEAWVFVRVLGAEGQRACDSSIAPDSNELDLSLAFGFDPYPRTGVHTWGNSD